MRLCTYEVQIRADDMVWVESPGKDGEQGWELVKFEPISEGQSIRDQPFLPRSRRPCPSWIINADFVLS